MTGYKAVLSDAQTPLIIIENTGGSAALLAEFFNACAQHPLCAISYIVFHDLPDAYLEDIKEHIHQSGGFACEAIKNDTQLVAYCVYFVGPDTIVHLHDDRLMAQPSKADDTGPDHPFDSLLQDASMRADARSTVAIVLCDPRDASTDGAKRLRAADGTVLMRTPAQTETSAATQAFISAGVVTQILDIADMPAQIEQVMQNDGAIIHCENDDAAFQDILTMLETGYGVEFSAYKAANVHRRIHRRMQLRQICSVDTYRDLLAGNQGMLEELFQDMLIGVTGFYRDPEAITKLRDIALSDLVRTSDEDTPLRVWVPGCASGEEAYTIAIELHEELLRAGVSRKFRIIATDIHRPSIEFASAGLYSERAMANVPQYLREKYFSRQRDQYSIQPCIRQMVIFSVHDALSDPPFMNLDLISCRNLLIYLNEEPQARIISMFLFGLHNGRYLFLGPSESVGRFEQEFTVITPRWRLFQKASERRPLDRAKSLNQYRAANQTATAVNKLGVNQIGADKSRWSTAYRTNAARSSAAINAVEARHKENLIASYDALLKKYAPSSILINSNGDVLGWFNDAARLIDTKNNLLDWTVENIVHPALQFTINVGMERLRLGQLEPTSRMISVELEENQPLNCTITLAPLDQISKVRLMLVEVDFGSGLQEKAPAPSAESLPAQHQEDAQLLSRRLQELERDLRLTEETLQHVTERLEASGEELQASNVALQASIEGLQASNKELHAVNDELISLGTEHQNRIEDLSDLNRNVETTLRLMRVGVIFVDHDLNITRFSNTLATEFLLQAHDTGCPLALAFPDLEFVDLPQLVAEVIESGESAHATGAHQNHTITVEVHTIRHDRDIQGYETYNGAAIIFHGIGNKALKISGQSDLA
ncbi:histidine kinase [Rhodobacteraceae bacterium]|nr:histidine kinase [Paracoccaceae bacterium]